jgi:hypothetical protein
MSHRKIFLTIGSNRQNPDVTDEENELTPEQKEACAKALQDYKDVDLKNSWDYTVITLGARNLRYNSEDTKSYFGTEVVTDEKGNKVGRFFLCDKHGNRDDAKDAGVAKEQTKKFSKS